MITPAKLRSCSISARPWGQVWWAKFLTLNYAFPPKTTIEVEGWNNIPTDRSVCFAMNHTDRYNCWPFQWKLLREQQQFTVSWVKAKYYEHPAVASFLTATSNIPLASRGYVIANQFRELIGRSPSGEEYRFIRDLLDYKIDASQENLIKQSSECRQFLAPTPQSRLSALEEYFNELSQETVELNKKALNLGHHLMIFPQGTRSKRLLPGHSGMAQMTQALGIDIVPIGCMGSDKCYAGNLPFASGGTVRYRIGKPLSLNGSQLGPYRIKEDFIPFSRAAQQSHGDAFQNITNIVMNEINSLLDEEYQFTPDSEQKKTPDVKRFI